MAIISDEKQFPQNWGWEGGGGVAAKTKQLEHTLKTKYTKKEGGTSGPVHMEELGPRPE